MRENTNNDLKKKMIKVIKLGFETKWISTLKKWENKEEYEQFIYFPKKDLNQTGKTFIPTKKRACSDLLQQRVQPTKTNFFFFFFFLLFIFIFINKTQIIRP